MTRLIYISMTMLLLIFGCSKTEKSSSSSEKKISDQAYFEEAEKYIEENYHMRECQIPMRDGEKLFALVLIPNDTSEKYPFMICRTPYSVAKSRGKYGFRLYKYGLSKQFYEDKYIFVFQDVRGRFRSEGEFAHMRPHLKNYDNSTKIDESTDTWDSIEWLLKNIENNNGKAGMWGISYPGFYAAAGAINAHPALKAVSPQAPISDWFWDDFHHNGAFFTNDAFMFFSVMDIRRDSLSGSWPSPDFEITSNNAYDFYLNQVGPIKTLNEKYLKHRYAFWDSITVHPNYDYFWQERSILPDLKNIKPAMLNVSGLFDAEDLFGSFKIYAEIEKNHPAEKDNYLVSGPWFHGGWARSKGTYLGKLKFGKNPVPSYFYRDSIELPFFRHYLKNGSKPNLAEATIYETGSNQWRKFKEWPPANRKLTPLYFHEKGMLSFAEPNTTEACCDSFISDPDNPVPYIEDTVFDTDKTYMTANQEFVSSRQDVLVYETNILDNDVTIAGNIKAMLKVSTSQTDADWIVKIIDVYPENDTVKEMQNYQQLLRIETFRGRFRNSFEKPEPFVPNEITDVNFELMDVLHTFKKGHKIMIQVQSTWFPITDRNPQKYVDNIYLATKDDFVKATHKLYHNSKDASYILLGILE